MVNVGHVGIECPWRRVLVVGDPPDPVGRKTLQKKQRKAIKKETNEETIKKLRGGTRRGEQQYVGDVCGSIEALNRVYRCACTCPQRMTDDDIDGMALHRVRG